MIITSLFLFSLWRKWAINKFIILLWLFVIIITTNLLCKTHGILLFVELDRSRFLSPLRAIVKCNAAESKVLQSQYSTLDSPTVEREIWMHPLCIICTINIYQITIIHHLEGIPLIIRHNQHKKRPTIK